ncbi:MAG TPA: SDR family NAD(P)-dependent oxidoreductase [Nitrospiraceae bacterium]|nr:SDR family NAD(P)-dependent oxidoreductase [Nitrospiraceae bacterium]
MPPTESSTPGDRSGHHGSAVLVTGGSGVIGRAVCLAFAHAGWSVGVHYHTRPAEAAHTVWLMRDASPHSTLYKADIRLYGEVRNMVDLFSKDYGSLNVMICNAGIASGQLTVRHPNDDWQRIIETNLTGTFHCIRAAGASMAAGGGSIIVIGSYAGSQGDTGQAAYASAKAGLIGLVRTAAREWGASDIRVNLVYPGRHHTPLVGNAFNTGIECAGHMLGRPPALDEVARVISYLAQLKDVSGQVWNLDSRLV